MSVNCDDDVEVLGARTAWNTLTALPDGDMRLDFSATAVRTNVHGTWAPVDNTLEASATGIEVASPVTPMTFSDGSAGEPLATIERDGHVLSFDVPFQLPAPSVIDDQLTYSSVIPGVDLIVTVNDDATGFTDVLRVESPEAAADPRLDELRFPVTVSHELSLVAVSGGFEARDGAGTTVFSSPTPQMWDSATPAAPVTPLRSDAHSFGLSALLAATERSELTAGEDPTIAPTTGANQADMPVSVSGGDVLITPDETLLQAPSTVWPVYIDPQIDGSRNQWTAVRDTYAQKYAFSPDEGVGICNVVAYGCTKTFKSRLLWQFANLQALGNLDRADIVSASFTAYGTHSYNCTAQPVTLYQVADFSSATGWPGGGTWNPLDTQTVAHRPSCSNDRWIGFNAIGQAQAIADANTGVGSLGLAANETSMAYWKRYRNDATFSVIYNRAPNTPTSLTIADTTTKPCGSYVNTGMPVMAAVVTDPDGGNVNMRVDIKDLRTGGTQTVGGPTLASGSTWRIQPVSNLQDDNYTFTATAGDGLRLSATSGTCAFTVDQTRPSALPGAVPVAVGSGIAAAYAEGSTTGGAGQKGAFTFTTGGVGDVVSYRYGFDDNATPLTATLTSQVSYTPTKAGPHHLFIRSVDRAGNTSDRKDYVFTVAVVPSSGLWTFDDPATSLTAADSAGAHPLTLSSAGLRGAGMIAELDPPSAAPGDGSVHFQTAVDRVAWSGPVVNTSSTFFVGAFVRLDDLTGIQTVVSEDGDNASGFELGYRSGTGSGCPTTDGCWAFSMNGTDSSTTPAPTTVTSTHPVTIGEWAYLMGEYDASAHTVSLLVCAPAGSDIDAPVTTPFAASWFATGAFAVGRGQAVGVATHSLRGVVDDVRVSTGIPDLDAMRQYCSGATTP